MRRRVLIPAVLALASAAALLGACRATDTAGNTSTGTVAPKSNGKSNANAPTGTTDGHADNVRLISVAELQKLVESGSAAIYDTRAKMQYEQEHIKGALSLPQSEVDARAGELPRDKTLVFYCTCPSEQSSAAAARILKSRGIENTAALVGGLNAWKTAGLPTDKSQ